MEEHFYLKQLVIQNFATFKNQTINFRTGLNTIIGETGSGKSLVLDALQLILGGRADKKVVRRETEYSLIEASFHCQDDKMKQFLEQEGFPLENSEIVIKRLIYKTGITKNYINHLACTVGFLSSFSRRYIDMVGQFENQKLLSESYQLHLLDQFAKIQPDVKAYKELLGEYKKRLSEQENLIQTQAFREQRLDYLNYQLQEIEKLNPTSQEEEELLKKKHLILNAEKDEKIRQQVSHLFDGGENGAGLLNILRSLGSILRKNPEKFNSHLNNFSQIEDNILALHRSLDAELQEEIDPTTLESVLERLDKYQKLKKKFHGTVEGILQAQIDFLKEKHQLEELEINLENISAAIEKTRLELFRVASKLHEKRFQAASKLAADLTSKIRNLKMNGATINIDLQKSDELLETGMTKAQYLAETNKGEGYFKIKDIASGGELSRILLGLRQILSSYDSISVFLFDEIDTGIGGETANYIGKALAEVSKHGQVIAITHLPQIAQFAEALIVVQKEIQEIENQTRTESLVKEVFGKMILKEVKAMAQLS